MRCLYCGREIGAFRALRDREFCTADHRKNYGERLNKAIHRIAEPEPAPSRAASFAVSWRAQEGYARRSLHPWECGKSYPIHVPKLVLAPVAAAELAEETVLPPSVHWMPSLLAEPVALLLAPSSASPARWASPPVRLPAFSIAIPAAAHMSAQRGAWMACPPAEPVTRLVASASARNLPRAAKPPTFTIAASTPSGVPPSMDWMRPPEAEPVECLALPCTGNHFVTSQAPVGLLALDLTPEHERLVAEEPTAVPAQLETWMPGLTAEPMAQIAGPAASELCFTDISLPSGCSTGPLTLPPLAKPQGPPAIAAAMPVPAAEPVFRLVGQTPVQSPIAGGEAVPELPELALTPVLGADAETGTVDDPPLTVSWMQEPEPEPVFSFVRSLVADEAFPGIAPRTATLPLTIGQPHIPAAAAMQRVPDPEPVMAGVWPRVAARPLNLQSAAASLRLPDLAAALPFVASRGASLRPQLAESAATPQPAPLESRRQVAASTAPVMAARAASRGAEPAVPCLATSRPLPAMAGPALGVTPVGVESPLLPTASAAPVPLAQDAQMTSFAFEADAEESIPGFDRPVLTSTPSAPQRANNVVVLRPISTIAVTPPEHQCSDPTPTVAPAGFVLVDYHLQGLRGEPVWQLLWERPDLKLVPPRFAIRPVLESLEEEAEIPTPVHKEPAFAEVFTMKEARKLPKRRVGLAGKVIAAGLVVGAMWLSPRIVRLTRQAVASRQNSFSGPGVPALGNRALWGSKGRPVSGSAAPVPAPSLWANGGPAGLAGASSGSSATKGPVAWVRKTIAGRASFQAGDNFHDGMQAWGAEPGTYSPRWERSRDGYVRPGDLALFLPSLKLTDYRFEFSSQLDAKGLGWVVRAKDTQNYYAMKVKVLEAGMRPIIAVVHYPVIGGLAGHRVETPLNVMVHQNTPFQVAVNVKGNRFSASIEGEEVDSWSDESLPSGGVGFFAEAGERARLYWARVSRNDDWLGRVCSMLSGSVDGTRNTSEWSGPNFRDPQPGGTPRPSLPDGAGDVTLSAAFGLPGCLSRRARDSKYRRFQSWSS